MWMVGGIGFEPTTPTVSIKENIEHIINYFNIHQLPLNIIYHIYDLIYQILAKPCKIRLDFCTVLDLNCNKKTL